jgi:teichuronic acid exporter
MATLRQKTARAILWNALDIFMKQGIQFFVLVALARILAPDDFGVIAILALFTGIANTFIDGGFSAALIQRQNTSHQEESTVFYFNLAMALLAAALLCLLAPWIAKSFTQPVLRYLTYAAALNLFVNALGSIHLTLLTKELNFKTIAQVSSVSSLISGTAAIVLAVKGFGVWSLAVQTVTTSVISVVLLWLRHPWRPGWIFSFSSLRSLFRFGGYLMVIGIIDALDTNLYSLLIGKYYSIRDVGFYERAQKTNQLPINLIMLMINRVAFSVFSSVAGDKKKLRYGFRKAQRIVMYINMPIMAGMVVLADPIIVTLFGDAWLNSIPILQVLGLMGMMWPMHMLNISVLKAQGRSDLYFNLALIKKTVTVILTITGSFYGIIAIAWAQVASSIFSLLVNSYYSRILLNYGIAKQIRDLLPCLATALLSGYGMWQTTYSLKLPDTMELIIALMIGAVLYLTASVIFRIQALWDIIELFFHRNVYGKRPRLE